MQVTTSVRSTQRQAMRWKSGGIRIGFVPTMGYLHAGHMGLVERARQEVGSQGKVVVSIFVNPTQFGPKEDLAKYPRDLRRDKQLCRAAGVDLVFVPQAEDMYDQRAGRAHSTYVVEEEVSQGMEGASRPTHFRGVATVVAKLFNIVLPDIAVFGSKDYQQGAVIQRMARDLNFPVRIVMAPTLREADGLAMSSRNSYLTPAERSQATALWQALQAAREMVGRHPKGLPAQSLRQELRREIERRPAARVDYIQFFDPQTLRPVEVVDRGTHLALAVFVGKTRLIDNASLR